MEEKVLRLIDFCKDALQSISGYQPDKALDKGNCGNLAEWIIQVFHNAVPYIGYNSKREKPHVFTQVGKNCYDYSGIVDPEKWKFIEDARPYLAQGHFKNAYGFKGNKEEHPAEYNLHKQNEQKLMEKISKLIRDEFLRENWEEYAQYQKPKDQEKGSA